MKKPIYKLEPKNTSYQVLQLEGEDFYDYNKYRIVDFKLDNNENTKAIPFTRKITTELTISNTRRTQQLAYNTLWDTGAGMTSVSQTVINDLQLTATGDTVTATYGNSNTAQLPTYFLNVIDLQNNTPIPVTVAVNNNPHFDVVLGKDFITKGEFIIRGNNEGYELEFNL